MAYFRNSVVFALSGLAACASPPAPEPAAPSPLASTPPTAKPPPVAPVASSAPAAPGAVPADSAAKPEPSGKAALASARRWKYRGQGQDGAGTSQPTPLQLDLVEIKQYEVAGHPLIELGVELNGALMGREELGKKGFAFAPFPILSPLFVLAGGKHRKKPGLWLFEGDVALPEAEARSALDKPPSIPLDSSIPRWESLKDPPGDRDFTYRRKVGAWESYCLGYQHPSPESGDTFTSERCYSPEVGLTSIRFDSVWGSFHLELVTPPAPTAAPLPR
jgi:hypothetical protein